MTVESLSVIYLTAYGVVGLGLGGTAVLGSRVTDLLYQLEELEMLSSKHITEDNKNMPCA